MGNTEHDLLLESQVLQLLRADDHILSYTLHSIDFVVFFILDHVNLTKRSLTNYFLDYSINKKHSTLKVFQSGLAVSLLAIESRGSSVLKGGNV